MHEVIYKTVRDDRTLRRVYYHPRTGIQVAVVVHHWPLNVNDDVMFRVCFPHEHAGWAFRCSSLKKAEHYIQREYTWFGKLKNVIQFTLTNKRLEHL